MTLLANRPVETIDTQLSEQVPPNGGTYVTTGTRPVTVGSYVTTENSGSVRAGAIRGRYVSLGHRQGVGDREGRYTDRG
ncbi:hypothetical protein [Arthrobacter subterraneus]|uniref:hypothetical protein n=1 Tax=Arthrobacter subterraneus TaxID=335973 RepID=UPI0037F8A342